MATFLQNFVVFEGLDGSGKSTQVGLLAARLAKEQIKVTTTQEPTNEPIGQLIRQVLRHEVKATDHALALLYAADRHNHLYDPDKGMVDALNKETVVLCDRYFYSSLAYQGVNLDYAFVEQINDYPHPMLVVYIDAPVSLCLERINKRGDEKELFEKEEYLLKVKENFEKALSYLPFGVKLLRVDASLSKEAQHEMIYEAVKELL